ncbi:MAG TPA: hypothetical protein VF973_09340 [Myxococcales bacterium]
MNSGKLLIAMGAAFLLMGAQSAQAAPRVHAKANSANEIVHASGKPQPRAAKSEGKVRGHKRPVQHDATLDYPQLG